MGKIHSKTIKDVLEIFEPYLTEEDILEAIEGCKKFREKKAVTLHINKIERHRPVIDLDKE